jgi:transposase
MMFFQCYPTFRRFDCKGFLTDALRYFAGAPEHIMIDNTHVVVLRGTGRDMVPVPEMDAFAERFGFRFVAHERGDANRSARVERPFSFIENNFLAGRTFASWEIWINGHACGATRSTPLTRNICVPCRASCLPSNACI